MSFILQRPEVLLEVSFALYGGNGCSKPETGHSGGTCIWNLAGLGKALTRVVHGILTLRKLDRRGLNGQGHMAARSSDGTRTQGFWPLGTPAWAIWTLPWEREEEERRSLETWLVESGPDALWLMESGPDALAWIPLVVSHNLVLPRRCQPRGIHKQPLPAGLSDVCFSCPRCWLCAREGYPS